MGHNYRSDYRAYALRFGEIAINKGFVTASQMEEAFSEQVSNYPSSIQRPHKFIGEILLDKGWMTLKQVFIVLEEPSHKMTNSDVS